MERLIALIPARSGSKRIPNKNIRILFNHPLIAYSIQAAKDAGIFDGIYVSSDSEEIGRIAEYYGAIWIKRPAEFATDNSSDAEWINHFISIIKLFNCFMILRPTSPFRIGETIKRGWSEWDHQHCLKAVEKVKQHPAKMWRIHSNKTMLNYLEKNWHLQPIQNLEQLYIQNASLEIRPIMHIFGFDSYYQPFFTQGYEGFDINEEIDFMLAELLINKGLAKLPEIKI